MDTKQIEEIGIIAKDGYTTYEEIGKKYNVTRERIRQILKQFYPNLIEQRKKQRVVKCNLCKNSVFPSNIQQYIPNIVCKECYQNIIDYRKTKWSMNYDSCIDCKKTESEHYVNGRCKKCYAKYSYNKYSSRRQYLKEYSKIWRKNNPERTKEINLKAIRRYLDRLKLNPEKYKKYVDKQKEYYNKRKNT